MAKFRIAQPITESALRIAVRPTLATFAALTLLFVPHTAVAQRPTPKTIDVKSPVGAIRGVVFDSMTMAPVAKAFVFVPGGTQTAQTDDNGRYTLADVPTGDQSVSISAAAFDSVGLSSIGGTTRVVAGQVSVLNVSTPPFAKIWKSMCSFSSRVGNDSGIVWGTVRDASNDRRLAGAATAFNWYNLTVDKAKHLAFAEVSRTVKTDSTGTYYACGLPTDIAIASEAAGTRSASGTVEYSIGARRLHRVDLLVSTDMVAPPSLTTRSKAELAVLNRPHGTSSLHGTVRDVTGKIVPGALVTLASVDTSVRTGTAGEFTLTSLPAGTHVLQVRQVGLAPATMLVDLLPQQTTEAAVEMPSARTLATFNVRADAVTALDRSGFEARRRSGFGYALENKDFANRTDITTVLREMPSVTVTKQRGSTSITLPGRMGGQCSAVIYIDGARADAEQLNSLDPPTVRAVEVYPREINVPAQFASFARCGVILVWTKFSKWGS
jgi:hypothetical protein